MTVYIYPKKSIVINKNCNHVPFVRENGTIVMCEECGGIVCDNCGTHYLTEEFLLEEYYKKIFPEEY